MNMINNRIINLLVPLDTTDCTTKAYCNLKMLKSGGTLTGHLYFNVSTRNTSVRCNNLGVHNYIRIYLSSEAINITTDISNFNLFAPRILTVSAGHPCRHYVDSKCDAINERLQRLEGRNLFASENINFK